MTAVKLSAQDLFRAAYENRYTWDAQFPGYTADVTYTQDGTVFTGQVRVTGDMKAEVLNVADEAAQKAIHGQLWEIAIHRVRRSFEDTHSKNTFTYGETDSTGAVELIMGGKSEGDQYKVRDNEVCLVHRNIHGVFVTINTFSSHHTGEGYLSQRYDSVYHDPKTGEQKGGKSLFEDSYEKVGVYSILNHRVIQTETDNGTVTQDFAFSNIQLLT
jgi:Protein of unknown function (DUF3386)